jgi:biopolymer transport protein ExbD
VAIKPSKKKDKTRSYRIRVMPLTEPNLMPIMNLILVLVPMILVTSKLLNLSVLEYLPPPSSAMSEANLPQEEAATVELPTFALRINIANDRFQIGYRVTDYDTSYEVEPTETGVYDFKELSRQLLAIKKNIVGDPPQYRDANEVMISAVANADFQTIVSTLDATRDIWVGDHRETLFPLPVLGQLW